MQPRLPDEDAVHKPHVTTRLAVTAVGATTDSPAMDSRVAVKESLICVWPNVSGTENSGLTAVQATTAMPAAPTCLV